MNIKDYDPDVGVLPTIEILRGIVRDRQYRTLQWPDNDVMVVLDIQAANAMLLIYDVVNANNKVRMEKRMAESPAGFEWMHNFCWAKVMHRESKS